MTNEKTRPELGELKPGQPVMVLRSPSYRASRGRNLGEDYIPAVVVKAARVWIDLEEVLNASSLRRRWRMRRDTQDEGNRQYSQLNASFATLEQHAWDETRRWGLSVLGEHGIRLDRASRWTGREVELADLLSGAENRQQSCCDAGPGQPHTGICTADLAHSGLGLPCHAMPWTTLVELSLAGDERPER